MKNGKYEKREIRKMRNTKKSKYEKAKYEKRDI